jgi:hypothetical protein
LAEYSLEVLADGTWLFLGCRRPPVYAIAAYGDALFEKIVDYTIMKGG